MDQSTPRVRIIHETNPEKYFPALLDLAQQRRITIVGTHRYSVAKEWLRAGLKDRIPLRKNTSASLRDLFFRLRIPFVRDEVIVLGFAPWDWRMTIYGLLVRKNTIVYHTSWPYWDADAVPRQYGPLNSILRKLWLRVLRHPNVHVVAVLDATRTELRSRYGITAEVIPHAVPQSFFAAKRVPGAEPKGMVKLIYVGGLLPIKGIEQLLEFMDSLAGEPIELTIVGDGPLRGRCIEAAEKNPAIRFLGPISARGELAETMAAHDILILLSQQELFGIVIAEAMAAGLGVIATNNIGPRSLLEDARLGNLFDDGDLSGPVNLIRHLASDRAELDRFRAQHESLASSFRLAGVADRWDEMIQSASFQVPLEPGLEAPDPNALGG